MRNYSRMDEYTPWRHLGYRLPQPRLEKLENGTQFVFFG
jgi:hypothetical protein